MIAFIDRKLLTEVSTAAKISPRLRQNYNFHPHAAYPAHRLLNAIEPGSYVIPHQHGDPNKDETMVCLAGRLGVLIFAADGRVQQTVELRAGGDTLGVDIPHGVLHSVLALESGTVFLEAKAGPYFPLGADEVAPWAPAEGSAEAARLWLGWRTLFA